MADWGAFLAGMLGWLDLHGFTWVEGFIGGVLAYLLMAFIDGRRKKRKQAEEQAFEEWHLRAHGHESPE